MNSATAYDLTLAKGRLPIAAIPAATPIASPAAIATVICFAARLAFTGLAFTARFELLQCGIDFWVQRRAFLHLDPHRFLRQEIAVP